MFKLILLVCVSSVIATLTLNSDIQKAVVAPCDIFNRSGLTCRDCNTLTRCVLMNNVWQSYDVDTCATSQGYYCNSIEERCSTSVGSCNRPIEFTCGQEGYFPNPFSCQEYYLCLRTGADSPIVPFPRFCESGMAYSPTTQACTLRINDPVCLELQWRCVYPGDLRLWLGSDDIFYICVRDLATNQLFPTLHKCLDNKIFDGINCVDRSTTTTITTTTVTEPSSRPPPPSPPPATENYHH